MSTLNYKDKSGNTKQLSQLTIATISKEQILNMVYPIGTYYWSSVATSPAITLRGGMAANKG